MKKLNNKGYLLVEIIVAIVLGMGIAYFIMNLTIKFSVKNEDVYKSITWTNDKNILTNVIMEDIERYTLVKIEDLAGAEGQEGLRFTYFDSSNNEKIVKNLIISKAENDISYGDYYKKFDSSLVIESVSLEVKGDYTVINIPMTSLYYDEDYGIKLLVPYLVEVNSEAVVFDLSGNYYNGTIKNASWNRSEGVLVTNGTDSYVKVGLANYNFGNTVTFMVKFKLNSLTNSQYIIGNWEGGGGGIFKNGSDKLVFELYIDGAYRQSYTNFVVSSDVWYTVVGVYDGSYVRLYVNGSADNISETAINGNITVSAAPFVLGANPSVNDVSDGYANVTYDNVVVFDRVLTENEISNYNSYGMDGIVDLTDLLFYYDF